MATLARPLPPSITKRDIEFVVPPAISTSSKLTEEEIAAIAVTIVEQLPDPNNCNVSKSLWGSAAKLENVSRRL